MTYIKSYTAWQNYPDTTTPITAAKLQNMDDGIANVATIVESLTSGTVWTPSLAAFPGMLPVSGRTTPPDGDKPSDGVNNAQMVRTWVQAPIGCRIFAPVWAGFFVVEADDTDNGVLKYEAQAPNTVYVSAAVETLSGQVYRLRVNGATRWSVLPSQLVQCDPQMIDVPSRDGGFWLRVFVAVDPGEIWYQSRDVETSDTPSGQNTALYLIDRSLDFDASCLSLGATLAWDLDSVNKGSDLSGNGNDGSGVNGVVMGGVAGVFGGATELNQGTVNNQAVQSSYNPFVNGQPISMCGLAYKDDRTSNGTIISGGGNWPFAGETRIPFLRVLAAGVGDLTVSWQTQAASSTAVSWSAVWPIQEWVFWALVFDEPGDTVELWINGTSVGSVSSTDVFHSPLDSGVELGARITPNDPWVGSQQKVRVFENVKLTNTQIGNLYTDYLSSSADQTTGTGEINTDNAVTSGSDYAWMPVALLGTVST